MFKNPREIPLKNLSIALNGLNASAAFPIDILNIANKLINLATVSPIFSIQIETVSVADPIFTITFSNDIAPDSPDLSDFPIPSNALKNPLTNPAIIFIGIISNLTAVIIIGIIIFAIGSNASDISVQICLKEFVSLFNSV